MATGFGKLGAGAGILFAVLFVVAVFMGPGNLPDGTDAQVVAFYDDMGNRVMSVISAYLFAAAAICYLFFMLDLRARLLRSSRDVRNWTGVAGVSGAVFVAVMVAAGATFATISGDIVFGGDPHPAVGDVARFLPELGYALLMVGAMVLAAAHVASTSVAAMQSGLLPRWLCIAGLIGAVLLLFSVLFFPLLALPLWALAVGVVLLTRTEPAGGAGQAA